MTAVSTQRWINRGGRVGMYLVPLIALAIVWEGASRFGALDQFVFPPPSHVVATISQLLSASSNHALVFHVMWSTIRIALGFALALAVAIPIGVLMGLFRPVHAFAHPLVSLLMPIPSLSWAPILLMVFGVDNVTCIAVVFLAAVFPLIYSVNSGIRGIERRHFWSVQIMGGGFTDIFLKVILPASLVHLIVGSKIAMARAWRSLVAAEMMAASVWGVGYMIFEAQEYMAMRDIYAGVVTIAIVGLFIEKALFGYLEHMTLERWGIVQR